ncbi:PKD domain-containing protein [Marinimicrobium agarilyticum]|uniref:PKD domain-containing protein n=1 Tax=Marinimicrobium agarilyticum TaxID=306546 RepID=UPI00041C2576|nr:Ig-like domain-containing protein [Marinimicrobium agarilyticum]
MTSAPNSAFSTLKIALAILLSAILASCGGSSGGADPQPQVGETPSTNIDGDDTGDVDEGDSEDDDGAEEEPPENEEQNNDEEASKNITPTIDAGSDLSPEEGSVVQLRATANDSDGTLGPLQWRQTGGAEVSFEVNATGVLRFLAPTVSEERLLTFEVQVADDDGGTASDSVRVTVMPVNLPPTVEAGSDITLRGLSEVNLLAQATDSDGELSAYQWQQIDGEAVDLDETAAAQLSFQAPSTLVDVELAFEVIVTDNEGATGRDTVRVTVTPEDAPDLSIHFPPAKGLYEEETVDVFGSVQSRGSAQIESVMVNAGSGATEADVGPDGSWRASAVALPSGVTELTIKVTATDTQGLDQTDEAVLMLGQETLGEGPTWEESPGLALAPSGDVAYLLTSGFWLSDTKLLAVDLATGDRLDTVADLSDETLGTVYGAYTDMEFDPVAGRFLLSSAPSGEDHLIIELDMATGMRSVITGGDIGDGPALNLPNDLMLDGEGRLWVTNNGGSEGVPSVMTVDLATGKRTVVVDESTAPVTVDAPLSGIFDGKTGQFYVSENIFSDSPILAFDVTDEVVTGASLSATDWSVTPKIAEGAESLHLDAARKRLILRSRGNDTIIAVDLATGERTLLASDVLGSSSTILDSTETAYDANRNLLYIAGGRSRDALVVVDLESGDRVTISR